MRLKALVFAWLAATGAVECRTEVLDRVAVSVANSVITEGDVLRELRVTACLNRAEPDLSPQARRKAADRLVERTLVQREMQFSKYPRPSTEEVAESYAGFRTGNAPKDDAWKAELARRGITDAQVRQALIDQLMLLRFIEVRFRPAVQVPDRDIEQYYRRQFLPEWRKANGNKPPPALEDSRDQIEEILAQAQVDRALDRWLGEVRTQTRIRFRDEVFK
jgi:hypothetical protein